jgi:hypothetical protein
VVLVRWLCLAQLSHDGMAALLMYNPVKCADLSDLSPHCPSLQTSMRAQLAMHPALTAVLAVFSARMDNPRSLGMPLDAPAHALPLDSRMPVIWRAARVGHSHDTTSQTVFLSLNKVCGLPSERK